MNTIINLLVSENTDKTIIKDIQEYISKLYKLDVNTSYFPNFDIGVDESICFLFLSDDEIKTVFNKVISSSVKIAILPNEFCPVSTRNYGIEDDIFPSIDKVYNAENASKVDLLQCNSKLVLGRLIIGNVHGMNSSCINCKNYIQKIRSFFSDLQHLSFQNYIITTAKGAITNTALMGIMIIGHNISKNSRNLLNEDIPYNDGKLNALILAPSSIVSYIYYIFVSYLIGKLFIEKLPKSMGFISSSKLTINSPLPIQYVLDGEANTENELLLEIIPNAINIYLNQNISMYQDDEEKKEEEKDKETVRIQGLPKGEMSSVLVTETLPFLPKAEEDDFKELFLELKQNSKFSSIFIVLIILSTLLATTGLFQNSSPVIIGAMILAPLMSPIISFSMGVLRGQRHLLQESSTTLVLGIITALAFSCLYSYFMPLSVLTDEMKSRLNPNILDLMVAIISGIAGAYASAKSEIAKSLAGVAIAVALVPPLSVTGIGIGWWNLEIIYGSFLLFLTNLAGITLSASLTFLVLGFAPVKRATKGIVLTSIFLTIVTIPLIFSFFKVIEQNNIYTQLKEIEHVVLDNIVINISVRSVEFSQENPIINIETSSDTLLNKNQFLQIKERIDSTLKRKVTVNILSEVQL
ncbi:MAG: putative hydrophobic protein (TIGR00271 family) [Sulfurimonas sp.]|jgi:uncharacterized hydrophobic protein (TIGR00271 family)